EDNQPRVAQSSIADDRYALVIRPSVPDRSDHPPEIAFSSFPYESGNTTHKAAPQKSEVTHAKVRLSSLRAGTTYESFCSKIDLLPDFEKRFALRFEISTH